MNINHQVFTPNSTVIVGLSGGPDSVALTHYLAKQGKKLGIEIIAAHLDHEWRKESGRDAEFCKNLCEQLGIVFKMQRASTLQFKPKDDGSKESMARQQRKFFFETLAQQVEKRTEKPVFIALAHHKQDQIETFFIRLIRGTTISGLGCMQEQTGKYIRPLLNINKDEIQTYLDQKLLSYVQDPTNESDNYLRNRIRNKLLPILNECDTRASEQIIRTLESLQETERFLESITEEAFKTIFDGTAFDVKTFLNFDQFIQKRVIRLWLCNSAPSFTLTEKFIQEVIRFLDSPRGGTHQLSPNWSIAKKEQKAILVVDKTE